MGWDMFERYKGHLLMFGGWSEANPTFKGLPVCRAHNKPEGYFTLECKSVASPVIFSKEELEVLFAGVTALSATSVLGSRIADPESWECLHYYANIINPLRSRLKDLLEDMR
tara:strand:+ start:896 stop:1231 length:336 start_codon:yes stop_codon:yes gene_type:complete